MKPKKLLQIPTELLSHLPFFLSDPPRRCYPHVKSRTSHGRLIIQIPAAASSDTPLRCLLIIITCKSILPLFFFFCDASALFRAMASHCRGFETVEFHEVRMSAPRTTPALEGQGISGTAVETREPWFALPADRLPSAWPSSSPVHTNFLTRRNVPSSRWKQH